MAYELKRSKGEHAEIKLGDETLSFEITPNRIIGEFAAKYNELLSLQKEFESMEGKDLKKITQLHRKMGAVVWELSNLVFGRENAEKIVAFYENNYLEMIEEVFPFFAEVLSPMVEKASAAKQQKAQEYLRK